MFDIDKKEFGGFITELRKEKGLTQKELAEKLFVSDKAVSKWECGLSMPDITLLVPLSKIFDITVTELLECKRLENVEHLQIGKVDELVNKAIACSKEELEENLIQKKKMQKAFGLSVLLSGIEVVVSFMLGMTIEQFASQNILLFIMFGLIFGTWFCFFAKEKLPTYYDEQKISIYSDGFFQLSILGVHFNNSNWKHIIQVGRIWSMVVLIGFPFMGLLLNMVFTNDILILGVISTIGLTFGLGGLFIPMYVVAKKYE